MSQLRVCLDLNLPAQFAPIADAKAAEEHGLSEPQSPFEAALVKSKRWRTGRTLTIRFMDGEESLHKRVAAAAKEWLQYANIKFDFGNHADANVRIAFIQDAGSWSAIGTDSLVTEWFPKNEPTMNYGWLVPSSSDEDVRSVVLHEFGHALGLIHEHQQPAAAIKWNKELIYRQLGGPPNKWDRATVDHNVFDRLSKTELNFSAYDRTSIMHYFFPKEWTVDGTEFKENTQLSTLDKQFIAEQYPRTTTAPPPR